MGGNGGGCFRSRFFIVVASSILNQTMKMLQALPSPYLVDLSKKTASNTREQRGKLFKPGHAGVTISLGYSELGRCRFEAQKTGGKYEHFSLPMDYEMRSDAFGVGHCPAFAAFFFHYIGTF